jgi:hypothetical protein
MANSWYTRGLGAIMNGSLNLDTDTLKVVLVDSGYTFDKDHDFISSGAGTVGGEELSGTGYTAGFGGAGRKTIANTTVSFDDTNNRAELDGDNVVWTAINAGTAKAAIIVKEVTSDADSILIAYIDTVSSGPTFPVATNGGDLTIAWDAEGILQLS